MSSKSILYIVVTAITICTSDSININMLFKKNKVFQARIFYVIIIIVISYLVTNFIYDLFLETQSY